MELKAGYKLTEIGVIPEDWIVVTLSEVADVVGGGTPSTQVSEFWNGDINWFTPTEIIGDKYVYRSKRRITYHGLSKSSARLLPIDSILLSSRASIGDVAIIKKESCTNQGFQSLIPYSNVNSEYLYYTMLTKKKELLSYASGSTFLEVSSRKVKDIQIALPSEKSEQEAIAKALNDIDLLISELEKLIDKKRNIKQGAMQTLLNPFDDDGYIKNGWSRTVLGEICQIEMGQSPSSLYYNTEGIGLPLIQGNADIIKRKTRIRFYTSFITKKCNIGDTLMSVRAPVGEVAKATFGACIGRGMCAIKYKNDFIYFLLLYLEPKWKQHSAGSTFESVNSNEINNLIVYIPLDDKHQVEITNILSEIDNEILALEAKLEKTKQLKQGMMQKLLTGQIRLTQASEELKPRHNEHYNEAVVLSVITGRFASEQFPLGSFRRTKFSYLLHRYCKESTEKYLKKAAGPYNPSVKYGGAEKIALTKKYVVESPAKSRKFLPSENIREAKEYFNKWYPDDVLTWLENNFKYIKNEELELFTTVDMAMQELKENGKPVSTAAVRQIISSSKEWKAKLNKQIFSDINIGRTINECNRIWSEI